MLDVKIEEPEPLSTNLRDLCAGELGVDKFGRVYYRTADTAACLTDSTYSLAGFSGREKSTLPLVRRLPAGSRVTLTVGG